MPADEVLGGEGNGWATAMLLLSFERGSSAIGQYTEFRKQWDEVVELAARLDRDGRPAARGPGRCASSSPTALVELECLKYHSWHVLTQTSQGKRPRLRGVDDQDHVVGDVPPGVATPTSRSSASASRCPTRARTSSLEELTTMAMWSRSCTIWGGSQQVQRTVVAERVLGLPR